MDPDEFSLERLSKVFIIDFWFDLNLLEVKFNFEVKSNFEVNFNFEVKIENEVRSNSEVKMEFFRDFLIIARFDVFDFWFEKLK